MGGVILSAVKAVDWPSIAVTYALCVVMVLLMSGLYVAYILVPWFVPVAVVLGCLLAALAKVCK